MATLGTLLYTWTKGKLVGTDATGNRYYTERSVAKGRRTKRWVLFAGKPEASEIPPEWHAWIHYTSDTPLTAAQPQPWQKPHQSNKTGSAEAYLPPGHDLAGGKRDRATGDYEAWQP